MPQFVLEHVATARWRIHKNRDIGFFARVRVLDALLASLRSWLDQFPDKRRGLNTTYRLPDIGMAAFSVFFMQSPSFLAHQRQFEEGHGRSNYASLFGIPKIPATITFVTCWTRRRRRCFIRHLLKRSHSWGGSRAGSTCSAGSTGVF